MTKPRIKLAAVAKATFPAGEFPPVGLDWETVPAELDEPGVALWDQLAEAFSNAPTRYRESDRPALVALCRWHAIMVGALDRVAADGILVVGDKKTRVKNPAFQIARESSLQCRGWARLLHLDSHEYTPVTIEPETNPFAGAS